MLKADFDKEYELLKIAYEKEVIKLDIEKAHLENAKTNALMGYDA